MHCGHADPWERRGSNRTVKKDGKHRPSDAGNYGRYRYREGYMPAELVFGAEESGTLEELICNKDAMPAVVPALKLLRSGAVGPVAEVKTGNMFVKIEVTGDAD